MVTNVRCLEKLKGIYFEERLYNVTICLNYSFAHTNSTKDCAFPEGT